MNPLNYASLPASQRLQSSGIVLETDYVWYLQPDGDWRLAPKHDVGHLWRVLSMDMLPAPSMAEVWRELPETIDEYDLTCEKIFNGGIQAGYTTCDVSGLRWRVLPDAANPTDALIDLLIWVRQQGKED